MWLATLIALPLVMNVALARSFEAAKLMAVAPMAVLCLAGLTAAWLARAAAPRPFLLSAPALAFFALMACAIAATAASETPWIAFFGDYFRREGLASWLLCGILFTAVLTLLHRHEQLERLIDVLLIASIMPCVYAVMQRHGYDFFQTQGLLVGTSAARPGGTMGNPTFLASFLLLVIPLCIVRALTAGDKLLQRAPWLLLLALQMYAALLTQSRGPLIGITVMLFVLLLLLAARARARMPVLGAFGVALAAVLALALINSVPGLAQATAGTPLQRFVFAAGDSNISSRIGIWQAGVDAFTHAPWWRQLIGYGPDAASFNYFNWMPALVQRNEGYSETIDRLHSEFLESLLSFGILGLAAQVILMSALVWIAAQRLLPLVAGPVLPSAGRRARPEWLPYAALVAAGLAGGALLAYAGGAARGLLPVGAGAGLAAAWVLFICRRVWRHTQAATPSLPNGLPRTEALLAAALISALIGSWVENQVGVPTIATRALAAVFAALLILAVNAVWRTRETGPAAAPPPAPEPEDGKGYSKAKKRRLALEAARDAKREARREARQADAAAPAWYPVLGWTAAFCLMISVADFFPPLSGARMLAPSITSLGLIAWPQVLTLLAALLICGWEAWRNQVSLGKACTRFLIWTVPALVLFCAVYAKLGSAIDNAPEEELRARIAALTDFSFAAYAVMALLLACALYRGDRGMRPTPAGRPSTPAALAAAAVLAGGAALGVAAYAWVSADQGADVGAKLAAWTQKQGQPDLAARFLQESRDLMPRERHFAGSYAARMIESAARYAGPATRQQEPAELMRERLMAAEGALSRAHEMVPRDPWITFAYANVNQFLALRQLESVLVPGERKRRAELARKYMALAHEQFPGHPWILRNWAQLEFDQGNRQAAFDKLTQMEKLDPLYVGTYTEWSKMARLDNNPALAVAAARRGLAVMPKGSDEAAMLYQELINIPREGGRTGEAISAALEYTAAQPERIGAWRQLAELYELNGQRELAQGTVNGALERFASRRQGAGAGAAEYAALQKMVTAITYGAAGAPRPAPGQAAPGVAAQEGVATDSPAVSGKK